MKNDTIIKKELRRIKKINRKKNSCPFKYQSQTIKLVFGSENHICIGDYAFVMFYRNYNHISYLVRTTDKSKLPPKLLFISKNTQRYAFDNYSKFDLCDMLLNQKTNIKKDYPIKIEKKPVDQENCNSSEHTGVVYINDDKIISRLNCCSQEVKNRLFEEHMQKETKKDFLLLTSMFRHCFDKVKTIEKLINTQAQHKQQTIEELKNQPK